MIKWDKYPDVSRMWETRGARFGAHQRLTKANIWTNYAVATGSSYVILLSLFTMVQLSEQYNSFVLQLVSIASIIFSVVIIFMSLIEGAKNYLHRAEAMHSCAREITVVYHKAEAKIKASPDVIVNVSAEVEEYDRILDRCPFNHDKLDIQIFRADRPKIYTDITAYQRMWIAIQNFSSIYGSFFVVLLGIPTLLTVAGLIVYCSGIDSYSTGQAPLLSGESREILPSR